MTRKRKVRTTIDPGKELEVDQSEYSRLKEQGLLLPDGVPVWVASTRVDGGPEKAVALRAGQPMGAALPTHDIQTTMRPDLTITVSDDEYMQLLAAGLVYSGSPVAPAADGNDLLFADKIQHGSATLAALRAAFGSSALPSRAGVRANRYDPARSAYNLKASNTRKLRTKLAAAKAGTGLLRIGCAGDSLTAGYQATAGSTDYVTDLRKRFADLALPVGGTGFVYANTNIGGSADPRWTRSGWGFSGDATLKYPFISNTGAGATATFTSDIAGTVVEILTYGVTAAITYSIDGGATTAITPSGTQTLQVVTVTGLANTTHTITIASAAGGTDSYLIAVQVRGAAGITLTNAGYGGTSAADWLLAGANAWFGPLSTLLGTHPDVVLLELGINDARGGTSAATYKTNLTSMVTAIQATGADVLLACSQGPSTDGNPGGYGAIPDATWTAFVSAMYDVADTKDVPLLDLTDRLGDYTTATAGGLTADGVHLNPTGYQAKALVWAGVLAA